MDCQDFLSRKNIPITPFSVEKERDRLSRLKEYKKFAKLYSNNFPEVKDRNTSAFWDHMNDRNLSSHYESPMNQHKIRIISKLVPNFVKILDIGFGSCVLEKRFKDSRKKLNLYGLEISCHSIEKAREVFSDWIFEKGSILDIPFPRNSFDYILSLEVLEHIKPSCLFRALSEIRRVLKKNGFLIISVPLNEGLERLVSEERNISAHTREYSFPILKAELELAGFSVIRKINLFAFHNGYFIKSLIVKFLLPVIKKPNSLIVVAKKK